MSLQSAGARDWCIWDSEFDNCGAGVTNDPGAGQCHVSHCIFRGSGKADISLYNCANTGIRRNTSLGSQTFLPREGDGEGRPIILQQNTIIQPQQPLAMTITGAGTAVLLDNTVVSKPGFRTGPVVQVSGGGDLVSSGNMFSVSKPITVQGRLLELGTQQIFGQVKIPSISYLPHAPEHVDRPIIEVKAGADAATIQAAITNAVRLSGQSPVLHLPAGDYPIAQTITIPAGLDLQLIGDGSCTRLQWSGAGAGPLLHLAGPTLATVRDLTLQGDGKAAGMLADNCDQPGAHIFAEQAGVHGAQTGVLDELSSTYVELRDFVQSDNTLGVKVDYRANAVEPSWLTRSHLAIFGGMTEHNMVSYDVAGGGSLLAQDVCDEEASAGVVKLADAGIFTLNGGCITGSAADPTAAGITLDNFRGSATLIGVTCATHVLVQGEGKGTDVLLLGAQADSADFLLNKSSHAKVSLLNARPAPRTTPRRPPPPCPIRAAPTRYTCASCYCKLPQSPHAPSAPFPLELTDLRLYRVNLDHCTTALEVK